MTSDVPRHNWDMFFDDVTKRRFDWETRIEIFNDQIGNQTLEDGLPLVGITREQRGEDTLVEIFVGTEDNAHQAHTIKNPTKVAYLGEGDSPGGIVEFEEMDGTKTLLHIIRPMPILVKYADNQEIAAA